VNDPEPAEGRRFDLAEANAMLPGLRESLDRMRQARGVILRSGERVKEASAGDGGGTEANEYREAADLLRREVERLSEEGIILRDVESGLVDFPSEREGRTVYLCWRLGEDRIRFWHDPESGFAGRRPL
jgi:hypothetical protein